MILAADIVSSLRVSKERRCCLLFDLSRPQKSSLVASSSSTRQQLLSQTIGSQHLTDADVVTRFKSARRLLNPSLHHPFSHRQRQQRMNCPLLHTEGLRKCYGDFEAVADLTLQVQRGEIFALLGPNGAGKTTSIRMLMGILQPSGGSARIDGLDCFAERVAVKRRVGYLPDEPIFYDYLRGREIIHFVGEMHGLASKQIQERAAPLLQRLELADAVEEYAVNYSRGMKKKLAVICALMHDPALLILDE